MVLDSAGGDMDLAEVGHTFVCVPCAVCRVHVL